MMTQTSQTYSIPSNHPSLAGHFPNRPIVPGVVLLDYVRELLQQWKPDLKIKILSQAKFLHPLLPEQTFTILLIENSPHKIKFECRSENQKLISGQFIMENKA